MGHSIARAAAGVLAFALFANSVCAQSAPREQERAALYDEGVALVDAGRWEEALRKFQAVVAIRSAPRALVALGLAQEKTGKLTAAKRTYLKTQADARETGEIEILERATSSLAALDLVTPKVMLRFAARPAGASITLDGAPVNVSTDGIDIDPGEHRIVVTAPRHHPFELTLDVAQRQRKEIVVEMKREPDADPAKGGEPPPAAAPDRASVGSLPPLPVWILAGAGATATAAGLIVRFKAQADYDDASAGCPNGLCSANEAVGRGNAARDRMLVGSIVAGVGALAIVGAGVWWGWSANSPRRAAGRGFLSARVAPSADGGSLIVNGAF
jgi:hypothetical protein